MADLLDMSVKVKRIASIVASLLLVGALLVLYAASVSAGTVTCRGKPVPTIAMPISGSNFSAYCRPCVTALRTFARKPVIEVIVAAYGRVARTHPNVHFLYGEIGFPDGGRFRPHRTHREGLSVDLMVPLTEEKVMDTNPFNRYGYDVEFNSKGVGAQGVIDFRAWSALMLAIKQEAENRGGKVRRTYFAPDLQGALKRHSTKPLTGMNFNQRQAWVRHDEHIHLDFEFPCKL